MATASGTIAEFLASVGFQADEKSLKAALTRVAAFGVAVQTITVGVFAGLTKVAAGEIEIARQAERLGTTTDKMRELGYIAEQSGSTLDAVTRSLEGMVSKNPRIRDAAKALEVAGERMRGMNEQQRRLYASRMGIDPTLIPALIKDASALKEEFRAMYAVAGIDAKEAARSSREFMAEINKLTAIVSLLAKGVAFAFMGRIRRDVEALRKLVTENFDKIKAVLEIFISVILRISGVISAFVYRIIKTVSAVVDWFGKLDDSQKKIIVGLGLFLAAWKLLNLGFLATPLGALIAGLTVVIGLVDDYLTYMEGGTSKFDWGPWAESIEAVRSAISGTVGVIADFIKDHERVFAAIGRGIGVAMGFKTALMAMRGAFSAVTLAVKLLTAAFRANPIGLLITGIIIAASLIYEYWEPISEFFTNLWDDIKAGLPDFGAWAKIAFDAFCDFWQPLLTFFGDLWGKVKEQFPDFGVWAEGMVVAIKAAFSGIGRWIGGLILEAVDFLPDFVKDKLGINLQAASAAAASTGPEYRAPLAPTPAQAAAVSNSNSDVSLTASANIQVYSSDPVSAGNQVAEKQKSVNADLVRNARGAVR